MSKGVMLMIDIYWLATIIAAISVIATAFFKLYMPIKRQLDRLDNLEIWTARQQEDIETSKDERTFILIAVLACLKGLKTLNCNGPVDESMRDIEKFMFRQSHRGRYLQVCTR
jgi:hypothetical protein